MQEIINAPDFGYVNRTFTVELLNADSNCVYEMTIQNSAKYHYYIIAEGLNKITLSESPTVEAGSYTLVVSKNFDVAEAEIIFTKPFIIYPDVTVENDLRTFWQKQVEAIQEQISQYNLTMAKSLSTDDKSIAYKDRLYKELEYAEARRDEEQIYGNKKPNNRVVKLKRVGF